MPLATSQFWVRSPSSGKLFDPMAQPPDVARSLSARLQNDDAIDAFLCQCAVPSLRMLTAVSTTWARRVGAALRARVRESDHSLAVDELAWNELDWLLRRLQRDGVCVERLRCEQATISFAPLLAAPRVGLDDLRACVEGEVSGATCYRLVGAAALCLVMRSAALTMMDLAKRRAEGEEDDDEPWGAAFAHALGAAAAASASLAELNADGFVLPVLQLNGTELVVSLDFAFKHLGAASAVVIAECIEVNSVLTSLDVGFNKLNEEAALSVVRAVRQKDTMASLGLARCRIGTSGAQEIADYVRVSSVLTYLNLSNNRLCGLDWEGKGTYNAEGINAIADALRVNGVLTSLNIYDNQIGVEGGKAIGAALHVNGALTHLDLRWNKLGDEGAKAIGDALCVNGTLTNLDTRENGISDEVAQRLAASLAASGKTKSMVPMVPSRDSMRPLGSALMPQ